MQQVQELCDKNEDGNYSFDFFDGYDELKYNPLPFPTPSNAAANPNQQ